MPVTLSQIADNIAKVTLQVHVGGDAVSDLNIEYYPSHITEKTFAHLQTFDNLQKDEASLIAGFSSMNEVLASLIKSWDFFEDEQQTQMVPITAERLASLPIVFRMSVLRGILSDIRPETIAPMMPN